MNYPINTFQMSNRRLDNWTCKYGPSCSSEMFLNRGEKHFTIRALREISSIKRPLSKKFAQNVHWAL